MDIKTIKGLISLFETSNVSSMEISETEGENSLTVRFAKDAPCVAPGYPVPLPVPAPISPVPKGNTPIEYSEGVLDYNRVEDIKSPMVGVFYTAASPDAPSFVSKGSKIKKGDTLCIIEAMKLMNEVVAERDGEIVEVSAKSGELVEFGQILFRIF